MDWGGITAVAMGFGAGLARLGLIAVSGHTCVLFFSARAPQRGQLYYNAKLLLY